MSHQSVEISFPSYNTIRATITLLDLDDVPIVIGVTWAIKIIQPDGTQKGADITVVSNDGLGVYHHDFVIDIDDPEGVWQHDCRLIYLLNPSREITLFNVKDAE